MQPRIAEPRPGSGQRRGADGAATPVWWPARQLASYFYKYHARYLASQPHGRHDDYPSAGGYRQTRHRERANGGATDARGQRMSKLHPQEQKILAERVVEKKLAAEQRGEVYHDWLEKLKQNHLKRRYVARDQVNR